MPAKKIKVIALDTPAVEPSVTEPSTEAEAMDDIINEIKIDSSSLDETTAEIPLPVEPVKAKAKRAPRATKKAPVEEAPPAPKPEPVQQAPPQKAPVEKELALIAVNRSHRRPLNTATGRIAKL